MIADAHDLLAALELLNVTIEYMLIKIIMHISPKSWGICEDHSPGSLIHRTSQWHWLNLCLAWLELII